MNKILILILLSLTSIAGCAGRTKIEPPDWNIAAIPDTQITTPEALPLLCEITAIVGEDGKKYGVWSPDCWKALSAYEITAKGNTEIAKANADALRNTEAGYNALIGAGKMQKQLGDFYIQLYQDEKSGRFMDSILYRSLIALGFVVVML